MSQLRGLVVRVSWGMALVLATVGSLGAAPKPAKPAPKVETPPAKEAEAKVSLGGRVQLDTRAHSYPKSSYLSDQSNVDWFAFRRIQLDVKAKYGKRLSGKISYEINEPVVKNAYLDLKFADSAILEVGKITPPFAPEEVESSKYLTFLERASISKALTSGDDHGFDLFGNVFSDYLVYHVGLVSGAVDQDSDDNTALDTVARLIAHPTAQGDGFFDTWIGLSFQAGSERTTEDTAIKIKPETDSGESLFKATFNPDIKYSRYKLAFDVVGRVGPSVWRWQYLWATFGFDKSVSVSGGFLSGSFFFTGEHRAIEEGYNDQLDVEDPVDSGGWGALELAARWSWFSVADGFFQDDGLYSGWQALSLEENADSGNAVTLALNWYPNSYSRLMLNWVSTFAEYEQAQGTATRLSSGAVEHALLLRVQLEF